jgi:nicotinamidase-related amidase
MNREDVCRCCQDFYVDFLSARMGLNQDRLSDAAETSIGRSEWRQRMSTCLILIDLQNDYFAGGTMELCNIENASAKARQLLEKFRDKHLPVIHVQHISTRPGATFFLPQTKGVEIHEVVSPQRGETVVKKNFPNSFRETGLLELLKERDTDTVVVCGAMSHMCVDATVRAAFDYGFHCIVVEDACATRDLVFKGQTIQATDVHAAFMAALSVPYAQVVTARELLANLEEPEH